MKRAAIYARHSTDLQNQKSCHDQIEKCKEWGENQGFTIVESFMDEAISGASIINRFGLASLMKAASLNEFDVVICEALDRLSRDQADLAKIRKDLVFHDVNIHTVQDGEINSMHVGLKGLMSELYLQDLAQKTRRGLSAVIKDGRMAGGRSYGYDVKPGEPGHLVINDCEAEVVIRIFTTYIHGHTPREIAKSLNDDKIPSPRGGKWNASTINGSRQRQNGILQNHLYKGEVVWNRQRFIKDPSTGNRVSRPNPESEWERAEAPHLRILDDATWEKVAEIKATKTKGPPHHQNKAKHLLSGLTKCGCCGASYTVLGRDRLGCSGHRERGDCENNRTVTRNHIEARILSALQKQLSKPEFLAEYVRTYEEERNKLHKQERSDLDKMQATLSKLEKQIERAVDSIINGTASEALKNRLEELEKEKEGLNQKIANLQAESRPFVFQPDAAEKYRDIVANLASHIDGMPESKAREQVYRDIRRLIEKVRIIPTGARKPVDLEVHGLLAALLDDCTVPHSEECRGAMVAGAGFEPATFRL